MSQEQRTTNDKVVLATTLVVGAGPACAGIFLHAKAKGVLKDLLSVASLDKKKDDKHTDVENSNGQQTVSTASSSSAQITENQSEKAPCEPTSNTMGENPSKTPTSPLSKRGKSDKESIQSIHDIGDDTSYAIDSSWWDEDLDATADVEDNGSFIGGESDDDNSRHFNGIKEASILKSKNNSSGKTNELHKSGGAWLSSFQIFGASSRSRNKSRHGHKTGRTRHSKRQIQKHRSLLWVDSNSLSKFGGGALTSYEISSNTSASCFIKNAYGYGVGGALVDGDEIKPIQEKSMKNTALDPNVDKRLALWLEKGGVLGIPHMLPDDLSRTALRLVCFGAKRCPLSDAGAYITEATSRLVLHSPEWIECSKLSSSHSDDVGAKTPQAIGCRAVGSKRLLSVTVRDDGTFHCIFEDTSLISSGNSGGGASASIVTARSIVRVAVLARRLVLGLGGKMKFPSWISSRLPSRILPICSDTLLRTGGLEIVLNHLRKVKSRISMGRSQISSGMHQIRNSRVGAGPQVATASMKSVLSPALRNKLSLPPTVVIIGGSHSAWSVASLLLTGSRRGMQPNTSVQDNVTRMLRVFAGERPKHGNQNDGSIHDAGVNGGDARPPVVGMAELFANGTTMQPTNIINQNVSLSDYRAQYQARETRDLINKGWAGPGEILLLHRSPISVWFRNEEAAFQERLDVGMSEIEAERMSLRDRVPGNKEMFLHIRGKMNTNVVNPLRGLRGDAKELWKQVRRGDEIRMQMQQYSSTIELQDILEKRRPIVIVWCGGYGWNGVPFVSERGDPIEIVVDGKGQAILDSRSRLQKHVKNGVTGKSDICPIPDCFATGLGAGSVAEVSAHGLDYYNSSSDLNTDDGTGSVKLSLSKYDIHGRKISSHRRRADAAREAEIIQERERASGAGIREDGFSFYCGKAARNIVDELIAPPAYLRDFGKAVKGSSPLFRTLDKQDSSQLEIDQPLQNSGLEETKEFFEPPPTPKRSRSLFNHFSKSKVAPTVASEREGESKNSDVDISGSQSKLLPKDGPSIIEGDFFDNGSASSGTKASNAGAQHLCSKENESKVFPSLRGATTTKVAQSEANLQRHTSRKANKKPRPCCIS